MTNHLKQFNGNLTEEMCITKAEKELIKGNPRLYSRSHQRISKEKAIPKVFFRLYSHTHSIPVIMNNGEFFAILLLL